MRIYQTESTSESASLRVLYTKRMKQTDRDGMYKIFKEKKRKQKIFVLVHGLERL